MKQNTKETEAKTVSIQAESADPVLAYAVRELKWMLEAGTSHRVVVGPAAADWVVRLKTSTRLPPAAFERKVRKTGKACFVDLTGHDASAALHAVYTLLEQAGACFDVTGPLLPAELRLDRLAPGVTRTVPAVIERGIRQHINFPMDISSYPLAEARDYIRNLARLRFNHISFHSYPKQWYTYRSSTTEYLAGDFFYGQRHDVPAHPVVKAALRNSRVFCIPEIEPLYDQPAERSRAAIEWLRAVMAEAKAVGMKVQFSMEILEDDPEDGVAACESVLRDYPAIDVLELMTNENGGKPAERLTVYLSVIERLRARGLPPGLRLAVGIYETFSERLRAGLEFLRKACPPDVSWSLLPAHGSRAVADMMRELALTPADWKRTRLYSWIEFDGLMYNQQNSLVGTKMALDLAHSVLGRERIGGLDFNHWRTAENRAAIRYAAVACIDPAITPEEFCRQYSRALGIGNSRAFIKGMLLLDETDALSRAYLFNLSFCHLGYWKGGGGCGGLGVTRHWMKGKIPEVSLRLEEVRVLFAAALAATRNTKGRELLRFFDNRIHCTQLHMHAIESLMVLHPVCNDASPVVHDEAGREQVRKQCDEAMAYAEACIKLHAEALPDRGSEGTLISYYETIVAFIQHIRNLLLGNASAEADGRMSPDGPPSPAINNQ
jgi:hypothetical protein